MRRTYYIMIVFVVLFTSNAFAEGWSKYEAPHSKDNAIAPVQIKDKGIYNLVVSIQFLRD